jgi:hypothetical protein
MSLLDKIVDQNKKQFIRAGLSEEDYEFFVGLKYLFPKSFPSASEYIIDILEDRKRKKRYKTED